MSQFGKILIVCVLYEKKISSTFLYKNCSKLVNQNIEILFFDNSQKSQNIPLGKFHYVHSKTNIGVSGAYNFAAQEAEKLECDSLWFFDQDTEPNATFIGDFEKAKNHFPKAVLFAPQLFSNQKTLSPFRYKNWRGRRVGSVKSGRQPLEKLRPINSGMLVQLSAFQSVGGYDDELPLDFSDWDFTDRLFEKHPYFVVVDSRWEQGFSGDEKPPLEQAEKRFASFVASAFRYSEKNSHPKRIRQSVLRRTLKLTWQHKSSRFWKIFKRSNFTK